MTDRPARQMILRKQGDQSPSSAETVTRIGTSGARVVDQGDRMLLIEGTDDAVEAAARLADGWRAMPVTSYEIPDTRERIRRPPS